MKQRTWLIIVLLCLTCSVSAQTETEAEPDYSVNEGTMIGVGSYNLSDTYLTPAQHKNYTGWGMRILNERMKMVKLADYRVSRQQLFSVDMAFTDNAALTASDFAAFVDYSLGYHYRFKPLPQLKLLAGGSVHGLGGFIYNTRNSNNPASAKVDIDLNMSALAIYDLKIKNYPLTIRYQLDIPFVGLMFSPHYGQSYYEIFNQGNTEGIVQFNSFHNKFAMKNYLTVDFPVYNFTLRLGYLNSYYYTDVNEIQSHIISNSLMIGVVKEFISFGGKRLKNTKKFSSAYY